MGTQHADRTLQIIHDMTNPVEAIVNLLDLIRHDEGNSESVLQYLRDGRLSGELSDRNRSALPLPSCMTYSAI